METEYLQKKKDLYERIFSPSKEEEELSMYKFSLFAANVKRFYDVSFSRYELEMAYKNTLYYQKLAGLEQFYPDCLRQINVINNSGIDLERIICNGRKSVVFATFHLGSYRLVNSYLFEKGLKLALIVRGKVFEEQLSSILEKVKPNLNKMESSDIVILNVNDRSSIFRMKALISKGYHLSVYLDGNTGVNDERGVFGKSHIKIPFLNSMLNVRKGIGQLAHLMELDIIPVISFRCSNQLNNLEFIKPYEYLSDKEYIEESVKYCYKHLEKYVRRYPWQWECWKYLHHWIDLNEVSSKVRSPKFNGERFVPFILSGREYLSDTTCYRIIPLRTGSIEAFQNINSDFFLESELEAFKRREIITRVS